MEKELKIIEEREILEKQFRIYGTFEEPLFLAKDVAEWIEHSNPSMMLNTVDEDEKGIYNVYTPGGNQNLLFLTEDGLYEVLMQSKKPIAKKFKKEVKNILKQIRKTGSYTLAPKTHIDEVNNAKAEMQLMGITADILHFSDNSKLMLAHEIYRNNNISESYLPAYTTSKGILKSATALLKQFNVNMSAIEFNKKLIEHGILRECERQSTKDKNKTKTFKNLVDTTWGENQVYSKNSKETQPMYYEDKFIDLLKKLGI